jgi:predicted ATPase
MLLSVNIANFRSCRDVDLGDTNQMLALVGRNGVGKTNILKAIEWVSRVGSLASQLDPLKESVEKGPVTLRMKLDGQTFSYSASIGMDVEQISENRLQTPYLIEKLVQENDTEPSVVVFSRTKGELTVGQDSLLLKVSALNPAAHSILSLVPDHPIAPLIVQLTLFLGAIRYYPIEEIEGENPLDLVSQREYESWLSTRTGAKDANRTLVLKLLDLWLNKRETFDVLRSLLGSDGLDVLKNISIASFDIPAAAVEDNQTNEKLKTAKYHFILFAPSGHPNGREFSFANLSFGTRRIIRLLTSLLFDGATVSLIEQPEDGIHTGLLHKLIPILRSYANPGQFLITSHSPEVLNRVSSSEVRLVDLVDGATTVRALNAKEIEAARKFMENDGPLAEFIESVQEL